jgi:hypothetical protein
MVNRSEGNLDALVATFIAGYIGYQAGSRRFANWEPIIKNYEARMNHLAYYRVLRPVTFLNMIESARIIYIEAILAYLFGLPNASIPTSIRCLEVGLAYKYSEQTGQQPPRRDRLSRLIDWAEQYIGGNNVELAHNFRMLRNLIHGQTVLTEQRALEAISYTTSILNALFLLPILPVKTNYNCQNCGVALQIDIPVSDNFLGNTINVNCCRCNQPTPILII